MRYDNLAKVPHGTVIACAQLYGTIIDVTHTDEATGGVVTTRGIITRLLTLAEAKDLQAGRTGYVPSRDRGETSPQPLRSADLDARVAVAVEERRKTLTEEKKKVDAELSPREYFSGKGKKIKDELEAMPWFNELTRVLNSTERDVYDSSEAMKKKESAAAGTSEYVFDYLKAPNNRTVVAGYAGIDRYRKSPPAFILTDDKSTDLRKEEKELFDSVNSRIGAVKYFVDTIKKYVPNIISESDKTDLIGWALSDGASFRKTPRSYFNFIDSIVKMPGSREDKLKFVRSFGIPSGVSVDPDVGDLLGIPLVSGVSQTNVPGKVQALVARNRNKIEQYNDLLNYLRGRGLNIDKAGMILTDVELDVESKAAELTAPRTLSVSGLPEAPRLSHSQALAVVEHIVNTTNRQLGSAARGTQGSGLINQFMLHPRVGFIAVFAESPHSTLDQFDAVLTKAKSERQDRRGRQESGREFIQRLAELRGAYDVMYDYVESVADELQRTDKGKEAIAAMTLIARQLFPGVITPTPTPAEGRFLKEVKGLKRDIEVLQTRSDNIENELKKLDTYEGRRAIEQELMQQRVRSAGRATEVDRSWGTLTPRGVTLTPEKFPSLFADVYDPLSDVLGFTLLKVDKSSVIVFVYDENFKFNVPLLRPPVSVNGPLFKEVPDDLSALQNYSPKRYLTTLWHLRSVGIEITDSQPGAGKNECALLVYTEQQANRSRVKSGLLNHQDSQTGPTRIDYVLIANTKDDVSLQIKTLANFITQGGGDLLNYVFYVEVQNKLNDSPAVTYSLVYDGLVHGLMELSRLAREVKVREKRRAAVEEWSLVVEEKQFRDLQGVSRTEAVVRYLNDLSAEMAKLFADGVQVLDELRTLYVQNVLLRISQFTLTYGEKAAPLIAENKEKIEAASRKLSRLGFDPQSLLFSIPWTLYLPVPSEAKQSKMLTAHLIEDQSKKQEIVRPNFDESEMNQDDIEAIQQAVVQNAELAFPEDQDKAKRLIAFADAALFKKDSGLTGAISAFNASVANMRTGILSSSDPDDVFITAGLREEDASRRAGDYYLPALASIVNDLKAIDGSAYVRVRAQLNSATDPANIARLRATESTLARDLNSKYDPLLAKAQHIINNHARISRGYTDRLTTAAKTVIQYHTPAFFRQERVSVPGRPATKLLGFIPPGAKYESEAKAVSIGGSTTAIIMPGTGKVNYYAVIVQGKDPRAMVQSFLLGSNDYSENNKAELSEYIHANAYNDALSTLETRGLDVVLFQDQALGRDPSTGELKNPKLGALLSLSGVLWGFNVLKFDQGGEEVQSEEDIFNALVRNFREQEEAIRVLHATRRYLFAEPENKKGEDLTAITEFNLFIEVSPASSRSPSRWYSVFPDSTAIPHGYRVEPDLKWNEAKASVIQNSSPDVSLYVAAKTFFPRGDAAERDAVREAMARTAEQSAAVAITSGRRLQAGATIDLSRDTPRVARTGLLGAGTMMQARSTAPKLPFPLRYMGLYDRFDSPTMMIGNIITGKYRTTKVLRLSEEKQKTLLSLWMRRACDHMNAGVLTWADIQAIYGYGRDNLLSVIQKAFRLRALTPEAFCRLAGDSTPPMPTAPRRDITPKTERPAAPKLSLSILKRQ